MTRDPRHPAGQGRSGQRRFKDLRFRQLRSFVALAEAGSFAAAAKQLGLAVPSVWQQVRSLEAVLDTDLVHAEGRSLALTDDGQRLLGLVSPLVRGFADLRQSFAEHAPLPPKKLTLAAPSASLVDDLSGIVARFERAHPDVDLRLLERDSAACIRMVEAGEADLAVAGLADDAVPAALAVHRLGRHPFTFVCRADHALASAARLSLAALARQPFVLDAAGGIARGRIDAVFAKAGLRRGLHVAMEAAAGQSLLDSVRRGFGVAVVPMSRAAAAAEAAGPAGLVCRDVSRLFGHETVTLLHRRFRCQPTHEKALCDLLMERADASLRHRRAR